LLDKTLIIEVSEKNFSEFKEVRRSSALPVGSLLKEFILNNLKDIKDYLSKKENYFIIIPFIKIIGIDYFNNPLIPKVLKDIGEIDGIKVEFRREKRENKKGKTYSQPVGLKLLREVKTEVKKV